MAIHPSFPASPYEVLLPEFRGQNWQADFQLTLHIQDNVTIINKTGNLFLTNIHRIYTGHDEDPSFEDDNLENYFLGTKPVGSSPASRTN